MVATFGGGSVLRQAPGQALGGIRPVSHNGVLRAAVVTRGAAEDLLGSSYADAGQQQALFDKRYVPPHDRPGADPSSPLRRRGVRG
jgi:hypothetical protein